MFVQSVGHACWKRAVTDGVRSDWHTLKDNEFQCHMLASFEKFLVEVGREKI